MAVLVLGPLILLLWVSLLSVRSYLVRQEIARQHGCKPLPSLTGLGTIFGLDLIYIFRKPSKCGLQKLPVEEQFDILGTTFRTQVFGNPVIQTIEPRNIQAVFASDAKSFGNGPMRQFSFSPLIGDGVMTLDGARHERARALIRPTFSKSHIDNEAAYSVHVDNLIRLLPTDGSTVDLQPLFERLDLDSSTEFIFGESVSSLTTDSMVDPQRFIAAFTKAQEGMGVRLQIPPFNFLHRDKRFWDACSTIRSFVSHVVDEAIRRRDIIGKEEETGSYVLVDNLIMKSQNKTEVQDALMNVFLPARDTTAILLSNIFFHLARNPRVWLKLRQQILDMPEATFEVLKRLKYLQHVINETLRLNPPVSNMRRIALCDTVLPTGGGTNRDATVFVSKGTIVSSAFFKLHRNKAIYGEDVGLWRPERWDNLNISGLTWNFMPFGGGPHACPGQQLALNRVSYTIVRLLKSFHRIENRDPVREFVPVQKLLTASQNGTKVALFT